MNYKKNEILISSIYTTVVLCTLWGGWEFWATFDSDLTRIIPPPSQFFSTMIESNFNIGIGSQSASIGLSIVSSIMRVMVGLTIGFILSILVGLLIGRFITMKRIFLPIIRLFAPIAPIAWIPLALIIIGIGNTTAIFIVFMGVFFTLTIATVQAIEDVPEKLIFSAKTLGASNRQIVFHVIIPYIMPTVFLSLRLNFIAAWMAVLAAEMTGLRDGLGAIIMIGRNLFNYDLILMGMFLIGIVGFITDAGLKQIQKYFFWWGDKS